MSGDSSQEKTEEATPKKLRDARKKGDVAKSRDLSMVVVLIVVFVTIAFSAGFMGDQIKELMRTAFSAIADGEITLTVMKGVGEKAVLVLVKILGPIMIAGVGSAILIGFLQVGAMLTGEPLKPNFKKLNPIEGIKNWFKAVTFIELIKNLAKIALIVFLAYQTISAYMDSILLSSKLGVVQAMHMTGEIVYSFFIKVIVVFFVIALIDLGVQRWNYKKKLRMSKDEVKREYKQDEGDPQIKGERRRLHREMAMGDARKGVKNADAVVSNPTHVAVAIKYDRDEMAAPEVTVKGQKNFAEIILEMAREESVPVIRNIPLAWALLKVEEGDVIPEDLYEPVAEVLSLVYEMSEGQNPLEGVEDDVTDPKTELKTFGD